LRRQLLDMPRFVEHLKDSAIGNTRLSSEWSRQLGFESRTPIFNDKASVLADQIHNTLGQWSNEIALRHGHLIGVPINWHRPDLEYVHITYDYAVFLAAHVNDLANDPDVGVLCGDLHRYVKQAVAMVSRPLPSTFCGPCPATVHDHRRCVDADGVNTCGNRPHECATRLMARRGALEVTCPSCAAVHRVEQLVNRLLARADNFRGTIPELHRVLRMLSEPVPISTLYRWAEPKTSKRRGSGQLRPVGYLRSDSKRIGVTRRDDGDKPLYRVSDARKVKQQSKVKGDSRNAVEKNVTSRAEGE